jgi:hypothetical protein
MTGTGDCSPVQDLTCVHAQRGQLAAGRKVLFCSALGFHERENARDDCRPEGEYARGYLACCGDDGCDTEPRSTPRVASPTLSRY